MIGAAACGWRSASSSTKASHPLGRAQSKSGQVLAGANSRSGNSSTSRARSPIVIGVMLSLTQVRPRFDVGPASSNPGATSNVCSALNFSPRTRRIDVRAVPAERPPFYRRRLTSRRRRHRVSQRLSAAAVASEARLGNSVGFAAATDSGDERNPDELQRVGNRVLEGMLVAVGVTQMLRHDRCRPGIHLGQRAQQRIAPIEELPVRSGLESLGRAGTPRSGAPQHQVAQHVRGALRIQMIANERGACVHRRSLDEPGS